MLKRSKSKEKDLVHYQKAGYGHGYVAPAGADMVMCLVDCVDFVCNFVAMFITVATLWENGCYCLMKLSA